MTTTADDGKIECAICKGRTHAIQVHLKDFHPELTLGQYQLTYPSAPIFSVKGKEVYDKAQEGRAAAIAAISQPVAAMATRTPAEIAAALATPVGPDTKAAFHELFGLTGIKGSMASNGKPIPITVIDPGQFADMVFPVDNEHVFDVEVLKNFCMAIELGMPFYGWGHAGTGKTTTILQICARTKRPSLRVQHSVNTEESHIIGQWTVRGGETVYQLGPLAQAMIHGWVYIADEYDMALPAVLAVYQAVLEGHPLVIKDAPPEYRVLHPHRNFRFAATGNTNGSGDETGLYQGTQIQNAANYERFSVVEMIRYMAKDREIEIIKKKAKIEEADAVKLVDFAHRVREQYDGGKISATISPRVLVNAGKLGLRRASFRIGVTLAFINRLSKADREICDQAAQRIFGEPK